MCENNVSDWPNIYDSNILYMIDKESSNNSI